MICNKCGAQNPDNNQFCIACGAQLDTAGGYQQPPVYQQPDYQQPPAVNPSAVYGAPGSFDPPSGTLSVGMLVWSIINIVCCCGSVLGIIGLVFTIMAKGAKTLQEEQSKLKIVKILNIIGSVINVLVVGIYALFFVIGFLSSL